MAAKKLKASERTTLLGKLTTQLKKRYGSKPHEPESPRAVLETLLYGTLLENAVDGQAEPALTAMVAGFHDLNEIRVSSIREIERTFPDLPEADWKSLRVKDALQHIFELNFTYDLDGLKKKAQEQAAGDLSEIPNSTPFMRLYVQQVGLGGHAMPVDRHQLALLRWLGLTDAPATKEKKAKLEPEEVAADELKSAVRKSDGPLFAYLLRQAANEPGVLAVTLAGPEDEAEESEIEPKRRIAELDGLIEGTGAKRPQKAAKKESKASPAAEQAAAKGKTTKKAAAKKTSRKAARKVSKKASKKTAK